MTSRYQQHIKGLIQFLSSNSGSELIISFVASQNGMLGACEELQKTVEQQGTENLGWIKDECGKSSITFHYFLQQLSQIVTLFTSTQDSADHFDTLGLPPGASRDEIKQSYRKLSLRYHPDTATEGNPDAAEKFIQITRAYHLLLGGVDGTESSVSRSTKRKWQPSNGQHIRPERRKNLVLWGAGLLIGLLIFSAIASNVYNKKAMLSGLKESNGAFVPPATHRNEVKPRVAQQSVSLTSETIAGDKTKNQSSRPANEKPLEKTEQIEVKTVHESLEGLAHHDEFKEPPQLPVEIDSGLSRADGDNFYVPLNKTTLKGQKNTEEKKRPRLAGEKSTTPKRIRNTENSQIAIVTNAPKLPAEVAPQRLQVAETPLSLNSSKTKESRSDLVPKAKELEKNLQAVQSEKKVEQGLIGQLSLESEISSIEAPREIDPQLKIDTFFAEYIDAYEQRNAILFSRFFEADALENGKLFTTMLPVYLDLFAATSQIKMDMTMLAWEAIDNGFSIRSRFKVYLLYKNSKEIRGEGAIRFVLKNSNDTFRISSMEYQFDN